MPCLEITDDVIIVRAGLVWRDEPTVHEMDLTMLYKIADPLLSIVILTVVVLAKEGDVTYRVDVVWVVSKLRKH